MASNEAFKETVKSLFDGMDSYLSTKSVVGEPIVVGDTTIIPLVDITFGIGAGTGRGKENINAGGGLGGKVVPTALLIIKDDSVRVMDIGNGSGINKVLDMVPDFVARFDKKMTPEQKEARAKAADAMEEMIYDSADV